MFKLADNSSKLHKSSTVILSVVLVAVSILEIVQPYLATLQPAIAPEYFPWVTAGTGIAIGVGRYIKQHCLQISEEQEDDLAA